MCVCSGSIALSRISVNSTVRPLLIYCRHQKPVFHHKLFSCWQSCQHLRSTKMEEFNNPSPQITAHQPWNKGKLIGAKPPLRSKHVWSIRTKLQIERRNAIWPYSISLSTANFAAAMSWLSEWKTLRQAGMQLTAQPSDRRKLDTRFALKSQSRQGKHLTNT